MPAMTRRYWTQQLGLPEPARPRHELGAAPISTARCHRKPFARCRNCPIRKRLCVDQKRNQFPPRRLLSAWRYDMLGQIRRGLTRTGELTTQPAAFAVVGLYAIAFRRALSGGVPLPR